MSEPLSPTTQQWWSYDRPATYEIVGTTVDVSVRDGITIACELRRPARDGAPVEGRFPSVVVEFSPYVVLRDFYVGEADFFAARGYNALVPLLRGAGGSGGTWDHGSFRQAGRYGHDLVKWLAVQSFSDGRVGMFAWNDRIGPILGECDGRKRCNNGKNAHGCVRAYDVDGSRSVQPVLD